MPGVGREAGEGSGWACHTLQAAVVSTAASAVEGHPILILALGAAMRPRPVPATRGERRPPIRRGRAWWQDRG